MQPTSITSLAALERLGDLRRDAHRHRRAAAAAAPAHTHRSPHEMQLDLVRASLLLVDGRDKPAHRRWA